VEFTAPQAARVTNCSRSQLDAWSRAGLIRPAAGPDGPRYAFRDLLALRVVAELLDAGLSLARVRRAVDHLVGSGDDITGLRLLTDGERVWACRSDGELLDVLRGGQLVLFVDVDHFAGDVRARVLAFDTERREFLATVGATAVEQEQARTRPASSTARGLVEIVGFS
jgi:DNA-binding transcriptional MerR regulator